MKKLLLGILLLASSLATTDRAEACGGCFAQGGHAAPRVDGGTVLDAALDTSTPPSTPLPGAVQVVTDHRMVLALSAVETTLWDQLRYAGRPDEFVWVLPVLHPEELDLGVGDNGFVDALDNLSAPAVTAAYSSCVARDGTRVPTYGCGATTLGSDNVSYATGGASGSLTAMDSVSTFRAGEAVAGPYRVELLDPSRSGVSMLQWLQSRGYGVSAESEAALGFYAEGRYSYVIARLRPGVGVQQMQPLRVTVRGYAPVLPLRMIAAGTADSVGLTLLVLSSSVTVTGSFRTVSVPEAQLQYDSQRGRSNYREVFDGLLHSNAGAWVLESSRAVSSTMAVSPDGGAGTFAPSDAASPLEDSAAPFDGSAAESASSDDATSSSDGALAPEASPARPTDPYLDRTVAFRGLGGLATLTRLRTVLGRASLNHELSLVASSLPLRSPLYATANVTNLPSCTFAYAPPEPRPGCGCEAPGALRGSAGAWLFGTALLSLLLRRRK